MPATQTRWHEAWNEQGQEEQPMLNLGLPPLPPWESPSPRRTFRPGAPPVPGHGKSKVQHISTGRFGPLIDEDVSYRCMMMLTPEQDEHPSASPSKLPAQLEPQADDIAGAGGLFSRKGGVAIGAGEVNTGASVHSPARLSDTSSVKLPTANLVGGRIIPDQCARVHSTSRYAGIISN